MAAMKRSRWLAAEPAGCCTVRLILLLAQRVVAGGVVKRLVELLLQ
jgi:hypothetical protein